MRRRDRDFISHAFEALGGIEAVLDLIDAEIVTPGAGLTRIRELMTTCCARCGFDAPSTTATQIEQETHV